jgi:predicted nucleic acid-binding protein
VFTEDVDAVLRALDWYKQGMDFADALQVSAAQAASDGFATFDKGIANAAKRLPIQRPILSP